MLKSFIFLVDVSIHVDLKVNLTKIEVLVKGVLQDSIYCHLGSAHGQYAGRVGRNFMWCTQQLVHKIYSRIRGTIAGNRDLCLW